MKRYPEYKKVDFNNFIEIPIKWNSKKLKYEAAVNMGQSPSSEDYNTEKIGFPFLQGNADFNNIYPSPHVWCNTAKKIARINDILLSVRAPIGAVNIADQNYGIGRGLCALHGLTSNQKFLYYLMLFSNDELNSIGTGSTYTAIAVDDVRNLILPIPSLPEQEKIASFLDHKTTLIDSLIAKKEKQIELLKEQRTALINHAVTKGLNPKAKMKDSGIEWLGKIPEHWEMIQLKYLAKVVLGKMLTPTDKGGYFYKSYLRAKNILWEKIDSGDIKKMWFSEKELEQYRVKKLDLLVSEGGEVGRTGIWKNEITECYIQNSVHKVTILKGNQYFHLYSFFTYGQMGYFDSIVSKVSIAHLTREKLVSIAFPVPPINEQDAIVQYIQKESVLIHDSLKKAGKQIELLKEYRTALISEAVTGKIDVREWEPPPKGSD